MPNVLDDYLSDVALAVELSTSRRTLKRWRDLGAGPAWVKCGARILYRREAVGEWLRSRETR
jgi:hypothetical protein